MNFYPPGRTAEMSGFSLDTLRYYEKIGLLPGIDRTPAGRRRFSDEDLLWLRMLRCLRDSGMPIAEMLRYAKLVRAGDGTLTERIALLEDHDRRIEERIARLREQQEHIHWKIGLYRSSVDCREAGELPEAASA